MTSRYQALCTLQNLAPRTSEYQDTLYSDEKPYSGLYQLPGLYRGASSSCLPMILVHCAELSTRPTHFTCVPAEILCKELACPFTWSNMRTCQCSPLCAYNSNDGEDIIRKHSRCKPPIRRATDRPPSQCSLTGKRSDRDPHELQTPSTFMVALSFSTS